MPYKTKVFMGPIYYLRLRHLTQDKATVRCRGKKQNLFVKLMKVDEKEVVLSLVKWKEIV